MVLKGTLLIACLFMGLSARSQTHFADSDWITIGYTEPDGKRACPIFLKHFGTLAKVRSARLKITSLGLYEARVNGRRVGDAYFTPGFTSYDKRLQYQEYEVGHLLRQDNLMEVTIGEGWYRGVFRSRRDDRSRNNYGNAAGLLLELLIYYKDGSQEKIVSDTSWKSRESGIRYSELYDGEFFDAGFGMKEWQGVKLLKQNKDNLVATTAPAVRKKERLRPIDITSTDKGSQIIDFGQNMAGWVELRLKGRKGDTVRVRHAELLNQDGSLYTGNLRNAKATDIYVLGKDGTSVLEPHFTYHGFRYAEISGVKVSPKQCTAVALYSDLPLSGTFACSDPMVNKLQQNIEWSLKSNFLDIPADCPQRSERLGWTGDAQVFAATASFLRDTRTFYGKWLADLRVEQRASGVVPAVVPSVVPLDQPMPGFAGWGDAVCVMPMVLFKSYGDIGMLAANYPAMKKWVNYVKAESPGHLWKSPGYGDWYAQGDSTSLYYVNQCYYANSVRLLVEAATVLGKTEDARNYTTLYEQVLDAYRKNYAGFNTPATQTQTAYVLALAFDLLPEARRQETADRLVQRIRDNGMKLSTGFLGTPELLPVLSRFGYSAVAYQLLLQRECPSWLYPITKGASTIWEKWDAIKPDGTVQPASLNHYSYGAVGRWLYESVAGISATSPGYRSITIKPDVGGGLTWAKGTYESPFGKISSAWEIRRNKVIFRIRIPKGITAKIILPGQAEFSVGGGTYVFRQNLLQSPNW